MRLLTVFCLAFGMLAIAYAGSIVPGECGDGFIDPGEECDPPGPICSSGCQNLVSDCPPNTYQDGEACTPCPANSHSSPGSTSVSDCDCDDGYSGSAGSCSQCPADTYSYEGACEDCPDGLTSGSGSTSIDDCAGCGDGVVDGGEECDDGIFNGEAVSDCSTSCTLTTTPHGCCLGVDTCANDVLESECSGTFGAYGVCGEFSPECPYTNETATSNLCDEPNVCDEDAVCLQTSCNTGTHSCEYTVVSGYELINGECVEIETPTCDSSPPCNFGLVEQTPGCCTPCPSDQYELGGECFECPPNTTSVEGSSGIFSCFTPNENECPAPSRRRLMGLCNDECTTLHARRGITLDGIALKNFHSPYSPGVVADLSDAVTALGHLSTIASAANVAASATQGTTELVLTATNAFIEDAASSDLASAALAGALALEPLVQKRNGAAIWVKLTGDCCESTSCCLFWSNNEWVSTEKWHKCSAAPRGGIPGLGFMPGDTAGVARALPGCITEATAAFSCP